MNLEHFRVLLEKHAYTNNYKYIFDSVCELIIDKILKKYTKYTKYTKKINFHLLIYDKNREKINLTYSYYDDYPKFDFFTLQNQFESVTDFKIGEYHYYSFLLHIKNRKYGFFLIQIPLNKKISKTSLGELSVLSYFLIQEFYSIKIFNLVIKDGLTGLFNKRYLISNLYQNFKLYKQKEENFCLAMIDIDKFKHYNDSYGHIIGDYLLKKIAGIIDKFASENNLKAFRYGGEEIVVTLPQKKKGESLFLMEKLRKIIEKFDFSNDDYFLKLTISIGVASIDQAKSVSELLYNADTSLYQSKETGRNKVTFSD